MKMVTIRIEDDLNRDVRVAAALKGINATAWIKQTISNASASELTAAGCSPTYYDGESSG